MIYYRYFYFIYFYFFIPFSENGPKKDGTMQR